MNAILRRELITLLRTRRAVAVQLGLALAFALLIGAGPRRPAGRPFRR